MLSHCQYVCLVKCQVDVGKCDKDDSTGDLHLRSTTPFIFHKSIY